jgi:hypothetical protein
MGRAHNALEAARRLTHKQSPVQSLRLAATFAFLLALAGCSSKSNATTSSPEPDADVCGGLDAGAGTCVVCKDKDWHCGANAFPQCPASIEDGGTCPADGGNTVCIACGASNGYQYECLGGQWMAVSSQLLCSP